ncbi:Unknown protein [Striga hermonthica]|uniref:Replication factor A C-terminal domain-containing protein n=1 Tax=Striga hermonthica TaxID=68872 RepID=A0A9N7R3L7_STRHE|nr:Unknown protein [Striga hermonthica]
MNKTSLWYESCKKCTSSVNKNDDNKMCKKCNDVVETTPRYRLVLNVVEANLNVTVTLFEDVGMVYVGCSIEEYIRSIEQGEESSDYYRGLSLQSTTEFQFLIQINHKSYNSRGEMNVVAETIARLPPINDVDMKERSSKSPKAPSRLPKNQEMSQKKQVQRRKCVADKIKEDANDSVIEIDDNETINSLKKKCVRKNSKGKEKKTSSPIITIKKEKS